jgi:hypothetical protein
MTMELICSKLLCHSEWQDCKQKKIDG